MSNATYAPYSALIEAFEQEFGAGGAIRIARAPGRSNLIGEHTDYNQGLVLPIAVAEHTAVLFRPNDAKRLKVFSDRQGAPAPRDEFPLSGIVPTLQDDLRWINYVRGVASAIVRRGITLKGGDLYITGNLPVGAGLSSSAALEISCGLAILALAEAQLPPQDLAFAGQEAEHTFVGVRTGIMDQTVVARAQAGCALLIDCRWLDVLNIPINLPGYSFALFDSGVRHKLASSEYNRRRTECEHAAAVMQVRSLRPVTLEHLFKAADKLTAVEHRRVRHVLTENQRVVHFAAALARGDIAELGRLLSLSHASLQIDYEVSAPELDSIVAQLAEMNAHDGACPGARMTGGGFGGAVVALLKTSEFPRYAEALAPLAKGGSRLLTSSGGAAVSQL